MFCEVGFTNTGAFEGARNFLNWIPRWQDEHTGAQTYKFDFILSKPNVQNVKMP
jgi:hypothetical protein